MKLRTISRFVLGLLFVLAGINHFRTAGFYLRMMPPYLPAPLLLVQLSGIAETALGAAFLWSRVRVLAGWALVALLIAVFPANLYMAMHPDQFADVPSWALLVRLPLQGLLIAWVLYAADRRREA